MDHEVASEADVIDRKDSSAAAVADVVWALRTASACKLQEGDTDVASI